MVTTKTEMVNHHGNPVETWRSSRSFWALPTKMPLPKPSSSRVVAVVWAAHGKVVRYRFGWRKGGGRIDLGDGRKGRGLGEGGLRINVGGYGGFAGKLGW